MTEFEQRSLSDFPKLTCKRPRRQVPVAFKPLQTTTLSDGSPWISYYRQEQGYLIRFSGMADFEISDSGTAVNRRATRGVSNDSLRHLYLNLVLPLALSLQKRLVLHGSAIDLDGQAVAFMAESGRGKSTLAASFASNGFSFLTDDGLFLDAAVSGFRVLPTHPTIRLWEDSHDGVAGDSRNSATPIDYAPKAEFIADPRFSFCNESRLLHIVYLLGEGKTEEVSIEPISSQDAVIAMLRHCFLLGVDKREILEHNLVQLAELSRSVRFYHLDFPRRYDFLHQVRDTVRRHSGASSDG